jgi:hypothetical protein
MHISEAKMKEPFPFSEFPVACDYTCAAIDAGNVPPVLPRDDVHETGAVAPPAIGALRYSRLVQAQSERHRDEEYDEDKGNPGRSPILGQCYVCFISCPAAAGYDVNHRATWDPQPYQSVFHIMFQWLHGTQRKLTGR